ncbi:MAG TPA: cupin domain-containing protein [Longimicrobiales bacterium]
MRVTDVMQPNHLTSMYDYPHTIENGHGERLTFRRRVRTPAGERVEGDNLIKPGAGPPMHSHHFQEEGFTVVQGRLGYQLLGESPQYAKAGESAVFPAGVPHRFWNAGDSDLICESYCSPPDNIEFFLTSIFDAQKRGQRGRPEIFAAAFLAWRYRSEYTLFDMPRLVQKIAFPAIVLVGTLLGKYRKFAQAPQPRRS